MEIVLSYDGNSKSTQNSSAIFHIHNLLRIFLAFWEITILYYSNINIIKNIAINNAAPA
jgi:hypothetical protein